MRIYLLLLILLTLSSCISDDCGFSGGYVFEIPATLSPARSMYHIGDTITVSSMFSNEVYDRGSEKTYLLEDYLFYPISVFTRLDTMGIDTTEVVTTEHFDFIVSEEFDYNPVGPTSDGYVLLGQFLYQDNAYELEYSLVPKKKGLYMISFSSRLWSQRNTQEFPDRCKNAILNSWTVLNDGAANNDILLLDAVEEGGHRYYNEPNLNENFHQLGRFVFEVQ